MIERIQKQQPQLRAEFMRASENKMAATRNVVIVPHVRPDYDAACAGLALKNILEKIYGITKLVNVVIEGPKMRNWSDLGDIIYTGPDKYLLDYCLGDPLIVFLDGSQPDRFTGRKEGQAELAKRQNTIVIDHHADPVKDKFPNALSYVEQEATSTCEVISNLFDHDLIDKHTARLLSYGILRDSQDFHNF